LLSRSAYLSLRSLKEKRGDKKVLWKRWFWVKKGFENNIFKTILWFGNKSLPSHPANDEKA
jgi:hypothetical protein